MFQVANTPRALVPLGMASRNKSDHLPVRATIRASSLSGSARDLGISSFYKSRTQDSFLRGYTSSSCRTGAGFLELKQDGRTTENKSSPNEDHVVDQQIKTGGNTTGSLYISERTCRRPCPGCNLETVVRRKQMNKMTSGLHVVCSQCKLDWCFACETPWHRPTRIACNQLYCNPRSCQGRLGLHEPTARMIFGDSINSNNFRESQTSSVSFGYEEMSDVAKSYFNQSSTKVSDNDIKSLLGNYECDDSREAQTAVMFFDCEEMPEISVPHSKEYRMKSVQYINEVANNTSSILNIEKICEICYLNVANENRPCCHLSVCADCIRTYLTFKIANGIIDIICPNHGCDHVILEEEISKSVNGQTFLKYQAFLINVKQLQPGRKTCPRCNYITVIDSNYIQDVSPNGSIDGIRIKCPDCDLFWCFNCRAPWHRYMTCREFQSRDDDALKLWASGYSSGQINAQKCPTCQVYIQRNGGCDHMKCTQCGTDFCYQCGERGYNHGHDEATNELWPNVVANDLPPPEPSRNRSRITGCLRMGCLFLFVLLCIGIFVWWIPLAVVLEMSRGYNRTSS